MKRNVTKEGTLDKGILLAFDVTATQDTVEKLTPQDQTELRSFRDTLSRLAFASAKAPRPGLKAELMNSVRNTPSRAASPQVWRSWTADAASNLHIVRAQEGDWEQATRGVKVKRLFADPARDSVTMLIRMDPGSEYPPHRHGGDEECLVLEGDLRVGDLVLNAGDYQCARASSIHDTSRTVNGCLLLIVSSMHDQLLA